MKKWCLGLCACAWATLASAATTFNDSIGDIDPGIGDGSGTLDIVSVEVSHTATDVIIALTVNGNLAVTDFGKFLIGIATGGAGTTNGNGWSRPINLDSPTGGMDYWIGSWVDSGGGAELYNHDGAAWHGPSNLTAFSFAPGAQSRVSFTVAQADLGLSSGDTFYFDVYASGGMPSDSAVDALSNPDISITAWDQSYTSRTNDTGLSDYTLAATADVVPGQGPFAGGNAVFVTNAVPAIGNGADITNVLVGGVAATLAGQGANWVSFVAPATGSAGAKDVVIQSVSLGNSTLAGAYAVNPAGEIGGSTSVTKWSAVGDAMVPGFTNAIGANNTIYGLGMSTSRVLYAGGAFTNVGGSNCYRVARYDGTNWSDMAGGVFRVANVNCIAPSSNGIVYAGGYFTNIGGSYTSGGILANDGGTNSRAVAKWDGSQWVAMGDHDNPECNGLFFQSNINGYVNTILPSTNGPVYAGGYYTNTNFRYNLNYVSKWTGTAWTNMQDGFRNVVMCMVEGQDGTVYAGGSFTNWAGAMSNQFQLGYVARWDGTSWTNMGLGLGNRVTCLLAARDGTIYAGGWFTNAANPSSGVMAPAQYVAKWTGTAWTNVGSGFNNWVYALAEGSDGTIYAGGSFTNTYDSDGVDTNAARVRVNRIARFDGARWQPLGGAETNGASDTVLALAADPVDGAVYAGGMFKTTFNEDGTSNNTWYVARYGSNTVSSIGVEPSTGSVTGGVEVVISGTNLGAGADITNVTICGASVASISSQSATQVVVVAGAGAPGLGDVVVFSTSFGETVKSNAFTYVGPSFALLGTNGAAVANGAAAAASAGTHFGEVLSGATVTNVFTITNAGNATLNLSWTTNGSAAFSVVSGPASVGAGAAADLAVASASSGAAATAAVEIVHDAAFSPFLLHLASDSSLLAQTITFPAIADQVTTGVVGRAATASSGLPVSFGVASGSASISGGTNLSFSGAGNVSIVASQGGDATYAPAPDATNTFNVAKAAATVTLTNLAQTYDGTARVAACTTEPAGLTVDITYDGGADAPTNAGSYAVTGTVNEVLYQGQAAGTLVVNKGTVTVTLTNLNATYDGTPKPAAATTDPAGLTVALTYDGSATAPSAVGSYAVTGTVVDANWLGEAAGTLVIGKVAQTIAFAPIQPQKLSASVGLAATGGGSGQPVTFAVTAGPGTIAGDTNLTFSGVGDVVVVASQAGDATYAAAADVTNVVKVFSVVPDNGPFAGGNSVTVSNGNFGTITNVLVGGAAAAILDSGASWVTVAMPAAGAAGVVDVVVQTADEGDLTLAGAYTVNPAGWIVDSEILTDWSRWGEVEGMPGALRMMDAAVLNGQIYVGGGINAAIVTNFCAFDGTNWQNAASFPAVRRNVAFAVLNGTLYSIGGQSAVGAYANVYAFNGTSWSSSVSLPAARTRLSAGVLNGKIYAVGGSSSTTVGTGMQTNVYAFDGTNWTEVAGLPVALEGMAVEALNGYLYSIGGATNGVTNVFRFDGTEWTEVAGLPEPRSYMGSAVMDGKIYAVGGLYSWARTNVYAFDGTNWTETAPLPAARRDLAAAELGGHVYAIGGAAGFTATNTVFAYPGTETVAGVMPASGAWTGGYGVVITGTNFGNGADVTNVTLCGVAATITSQTTRRVWVVAAPGTAGVGDVAVQSTSYGTTVKSNAFEYLRGAQAPLAFAPASPQAHASTNGLAVSGGSGTGAVSYAVTAGPGTIVGDTNLAVTSGSGTITVVATKAQDDRYFAAAATATVAAAKADQAIADFLPTNGSTFAATDAAGLAATSSSGLAVAFAVGSGPGSISGGTNLTFTGAGAVAVVASQAGDADWNAAASVTQTYVVAKAPQAALAFAPASPQTFGTTNALSAPGGSGTGAVSYSIAAGLGEIVGTNGLHALAGTGSVTVVATKAADDLYLSVAATATVAYAKAAAQVFLLDLAQVYDGTARTISATTLPAGLTVEFTYGGSATAPTNAGSYAVTGTVNDADWQGSAAGTLAVARAQDAIVFGATNQTYDGTGKAVTAVADSGAAVTVTYDGAADLPVNAGTYAVTGVVDAANWQATNATTLTIAKADQAITNFLPADGAQFVLGASTTLSAQAQSGFAVAFSNLTPEVVRLVGATIAFTSPGVARVQAGQAGDANWNAATPVVHEWRVGGLITNVAPGAANVGGGIEVTIQGVALGDGTDVASVALCGVAASIVTQSANAVTVLAEAAPGTATGAVEVVSGTGGRMVLSNAFEYLWLDAPVQLAPTNVLLDRLTARWQAVSNATAYFLEAGLDENFAAHVPGYEFLDAGAATNAQVDGLLDETPYWLRVFAWNDHGLSWASLVKRVVTPTVNAADYDGDGQGELATFAATNATWDFLSYRVDFGWDAKYGWATALPVPADYDGDGVADLAVYHPAAGDWYVQPSAGGADRQEHLGSAAAAQVPGDYDGDGRADLAVFDRTNGGRWSFRCSTDGDYDLSWGWSAVVPTPADYDGDGRTDVAVYHPASGNWYLVDLSRRRGAVVPQVVPWGWAAAVPVPADYDGDGVADLAVYHAASGNWYVRQSSDLATVVKALGGPGQAPTGLYPQIHSWYRLP